MARRRKQVEEVDPFSHVFGADAVTLDAIPDFQVLRTQIPGLNRATWVNGIPTGCAIVVHGPNAGGKTTLVTACLASAQRDGHIVAFVDAERTADKSWFKRLRLDLNKCAYKLPTSIEDASEWIHDRINKFTSAQDAGSIPPDKQFHIAIDSITKMQPDEVVKGKLGQKNYGAQANAMSFWLSILIPLIGKTNVVVWLIAQERKRMNAKPWETPYKLTSGEAVLFDAALRFRVTPAGKVKEKVDGDDVVVGRKHRITIAKNKFGPDGEEVIFYLSNGKGVSPLGLDRSRMLMDECAEVGVALKNKPKKSWWTFQDLEGDELASFFGEKKAILGIRSDPSLFAALSECLSTKNDEMYQKVLRDRDDLNNFGDDEDEPAPQPKRKRRRSERNAGEQKVSKKLKRSRR